MLDQGDRMIKKRLWLSSYYPTVKIMPKHVIIAVPKITLAVIMAGIGVSFLLSACQYLNSL